MASGSFVGRTGGGEFLIEVLLSGQHLSIVQIRPRVRPKVWAYLPIRHS